MGHLRVDHRHVLEEHRLQVINDLKPYSSDALRNYVGYGQTGAWAFLCSFAAVASPANGGGFRTTAVNYYNLTGYLLDTIHSDPTAAGPAPNNCTLSDANALAISAWCAGRVAGGLPLTVALFNAACLAQVGGATGIGVGNSTATLEQILRILTGEIYCLPAGAISGAGAVPAATQGGAFLATAQGYFVVEPNVQVGTDVRGRNISRPVGWGTAVQVAPQDLHWRDVRVLYNTGELHRSIVNGQLSKVLPGRRPDRATHSSAGGRPRGSGSTRTEAAPDRGQTERRRAAHAGERPSRPVQQPPARSGWQSEPREETERAPCGSILGRVSADRRCDHESSYRSILSAQCRDRENGYAGTGKPAESFPCGRGPVASFHAAAGRSPHSTRPVTMSCAARSIFRWRSASRSTASRRC